MYYVYILKSFKTDKHYIGHTASIEKRLDKHNKGEVTSTRHAIPWECIYSEKYAVKNIAMKRELEIKSYKGGIKFKNLLNSKGIIR
jgi:putative endonuclease